MPLRHILPLLLVLAGGCSRQANEPLTETDRMTNPVPYGSWPSPITAAAVVEGSRALGEPRNTLVALSDRDNWWNIYRVDGDRFTAIDSGIEQAEIGGPDWEVGQNFYHLLEDGRILAQVMRGGVETPVVIDPSAPGSEALGLSSVSIIDLLPVGDRLFVVNAFADRPAALLESDLEGNTSTIIRTAQSVRDDIRRTEIPGHPHCLPGL